ncbi:MAG: molybdopterin cofactor-binding domain-containing protein, partial [Casimicrobiaceae bacterium]
MTKTVANPSRRKFVVTSAAAGGGLAIGLHVSMLSAATAAKGASGPVEVNAWVVVKPDDTCVIRVARSEMGQGTLTGLAQLVVEELECDWNKVGYE